MIILIVGLVHDLLEKGDFEILAKVYQQDFPTSKVSLTLKFKMSEEANPESFKSKDPAAESELDGIHAVSDSVHILFKITHLGPGLREQEQPTESKSYSDIKNSSS